MPEIPEERWQELEGQAVPERFLAEPAAAWAAPLLEWVAAAAAPPAGTRLGNYEIVRELGRGGMASVYLARDRKHDRDVALKVLHPDLAASVAAEQFLQEVRLSARFEHPHILTLIDSGLTDGFLWYVLPPIRGPSLRQRLERESRLGIDEAIAITRQVAAALDHAHRHGVVHRDLKPENILLHEGEAMLADFGIALAVHDAGGARPPGADSPIGTAHYMSPEQARGQDELDPRSDVYALGVVTYEMLAGTRPHTGATAREVIARILADPPAPLRTLRHDIPRELEAAVARALARAPEERFGSAGDFARALDRARAAQLRRRQVVRAAALAAGAGVTVIATWLLAPGGPPEAYPDALTVHARTQLTFTGNAQRPAISPDGRELAYVVVTCSGAACRQAIEIQGVGDATTRRRVVAGATMIYRITWSPDRRHLLFIGTVGGGYGVHLVPARGGPPRMVAAGPGGFASFLAGGDSLLVTSRAGGEAWLRTTSLAGEPGDSIPVGSPGLGLLTAYGVAGGRWIAVGARPDGRIEWRILDRRGRQRDVYRPDAQLVNAWLGNRVSEDALWLFALPRRDAGGVLLRLGIDPASGRFTGPPDTVLHASRPAFDVTSDGRSVVLSEGTLHYEVWAAELADALKGALPAEARRTSGTARILSVISPDGRRLLLHGPQEEISVIPWRGAGAVRHALAGELVADCFGWTPDGGALWYAERLDRRIRFVTADPATGAVGSVLPIADSAMIGCVPLARKGFAWIPAPTGLRYQEIGDRHARELPRPAEYALLQYVNSSPDGRRLLTEGWNAAGDSLLFHVMSLPDGRAVPLAGFPGEGGEAAWLEDGSILLEIWDGESETVYRALGPGRVERLGQLPTPSVLRITPSYDGRRLSFTSVEFRGDIWLARLGQPR